MIYQILRFKKFPLYLGITVFVASLLFAYFRSSQSAGQLPWMVGIAFFIWMTVLAGENLPRCTLFEAALPIRARDLFCAHVLLTLILLWTFLLIIISAVQGGGGADFIPFLFMAGAIGTLAHIARDCIGAAAEFMTPRWGRWARSLLIFVLLMVLLPLTFVMSSIETVCVVAILGLGSAALFLRTRTSLPESFRSAPDEPIKEKLRGSGLALPSSARWLALRRIYNYQPIAWLVLAVGIGAMGLLFEECAWFIIAFMPMRKRLTVDNRWLFLLPISRQRLFAMITLPPLAAITVCCLIQLHFSPLPAAVIVLDGVAVAGVCLLVFSIIGLFSFFPQGGSWRRLSQTLALILPVGWVIYQFFTPPKGQFWKRGLSPFEMWVASLAPNHLPLLMVSAAAALIILYGLACAGFCRMDIPPKRTTATR